MKTLYFFILLLISSPATADEAITISLEETVHQFMRTVHEKNIEGILSYIPKRGLLDNDLWVNKEDITKDLNNKKSKLYSHIFSLNMGCNGEVKTIVSPYKFIEVYGENYDVKIRSIKGSNLNVYGVSLEPIFKDKKCNLVLWHSVFQKIDKKYFLYSYFFQ